MRVVLENSCGVPVTGASSSQIVTDAYVSIAVTADYEAGTEYKLKKANGEFCVNERGKKQLNRFSAAIEICVIDPDLIAMFLGGTVITTGAPATGTGLWIGEGLIVNRFSLEVWQEAAGAGACAPGGQTRYLYWAFPNMGDAEMGDFTVQDGTFTLTFTAETAAAADEWGNGPGTGTSWIGPVTAGSPTAKHIGFNISTIPPPAETGCGAVAL
jgi:hypothetical protein